MKLSFIKSSNKNFKANQTLLNTPPLPIACFAALGLPPPQSAHKLDHCFRLHISLSHAMFRLKDKKKLKRIATCTHTTARRSLQSKNCAPRTWMWDTYTREKHWPYASSLSTALFLSHRPAQTVKICYIYDQCGKALGARYLSLELSALFDAKELLAKVPCQRVSHALGRQKRTEISTIAILSQSCHVRVWVCVRMVMHVLRHRDFLNMASSKYSRVGFRLRKDQNKIML